jgi:hypothetical protein
MARRIQKKTSQQNEPTSSGLTAIVNGDAIPVTVGTRELWIRPPTPEEYDECRFEESVARSVAMLHPSVRKMANQPPSETFSAVVESLVDDATKELETAPDSQKESIQMRIRALKLNRDTKTRASELADERAGVRRDRWLALHLLIDADGEQVFDLEKGEEDPAWQKFCKSPAREAVRPAIWQQLERADNAPLPWEATADSS